MITKKQLIATTLRESNCPPMYRKVIVEELERRLQETVVKVCSDFRYLGVPCCESCHVGYAHYDMELITLSDQTSAWLCCAVAVALCQSRKE
jgi:hypothetical protein